MKDHGLLFTDEMVRAYLEGRKTQTRRPLKWAVNQVGEPVDHLCQIGTTGRWIAWWGPASLESCQQLTDRAYGGRDGFPQRYHAGDHVWARECWKITSNPDAPYSGLAIQYRADDWSRYLEFNEYEHATRWVDEAAPWRPSIHMPRWAARIVLPIVSVRHERVRDITEQDARAEGVKPLPLLENYWDDLEAPQQYSTCREAFMSLWRNLYGVKYPPETAWCVVIETEPYRGAAR